MNCGDGAFPNGIVLGADGNFYGTTHQGGGPAAGPSCFSSCGTAFRLTPGGVFTLIHALNGGSDGTTPSALTSASDGSFYALSLSASASGALLRVTTAGKFRAVPFNFANINTLVQSGLAEANGKLYAVACHYLIHEHILFEINLDGTNLQALPTFERCVAEESKASLLAASDGNLWVGSASRDSCTLPAAVTALSPKTGFPLNVFPFVGANGSAPVSSLIQAKDGTLCGTIFNGGTVTKGTANGVIFRLRADSPPAR